MISRIWHGWTKREDADKYEQMLRADVLPGTGEANRKGARFLEGPIAAQALGGPAAGMSAAGAQPALPNTIPLLACHPTIVVNICAPSQTLACRPSVKDVSRLVPGTRSY